MSTESNRVVSNEVKSNVLATDQGAAQSVFMSQGPGDEAHCAFLQMMIDMFTTYMQANLTAQQPPPHICLPRHPCLQSLIR